MIRPDVERRLELTEIEKVRFLNARSRYEWFVSEFYQLATKIEWSVNPRHSVVPFGLERAGYSPNSRVLKAPPEDPGEKFCYGLADGHVIFNQRYGTLKGRKNEEFREYEAGRVSTTLYDYHEPDKDPVNVEVLFLTDSIPTGFIRYARFGLAVESYEYNDGLLVTAYAAKQVHDPADPRHKISLSSDSFVYDEKNRLTEVVRTWQSGEHERLYRKR